MKQKRDILATIALPYANGPLHLGHMIEAIQADVWVRYQKMQGHTCHFVCGSDAHGTAIMLSAEEKNLPPEDYIEAIREDHYADYRSFLVDFDLFHTTHSAENQALSAKIYNKLNKQGDISSREITQAFDPEKSLFLADRFIKGTCPKCNTGDQYGDNCESCGATYDPTELKDPYSTLSGAKPINKDSVHYFFLINRYQDVIQRWAKEGGVDTPTFNKLNEWFKTGLKDWDISRDAPYFGFEIPGAPGKFFYVWLDAPIGYMASFKKLCEQNPDINFDHYWNKDSKSELYHFIGKDIVYFHALFWPALLHASGHRLPTALFAHGFLTINGQKMSKSRKTFITAKEYLNHYDAEFIRYYFCAKLTGQVEDIDINGEDFVARVNADLVGKYANLASRCAGFITKKFDGKLAGSLHDETLTQQFIDAKKIIGDSYDTRNTNKAIREIMHLADLANQYIDHHKPWALAKIEGKEDDVQKICSQGLECFRLLTLYLKPILPETAKKVEHFLNIPPLTWNDTESFMLNNNINRFKPLICRIAASSDTDTDGSTIF